jgi:hypothetical protein
MRDCSLNRFQDEGKLLINAEYRFPLRKELGRKVFMDGARLAFLNLASWAGSNQASSTSKPVKNFQNLSTEPV